MGSEKQFCRFGRPTEAFTLQLIQHDQARPAQDSSSSQLELSRHRHRGTSIRTLTTVQDGLFPIEGCTPPHPPPFRLPTILRSVCLPPQLLDSRNHQDRDARYQRDPAYRDQPGPEQGGRLVEESEAALAGHDRPAVRADGLQPPGMRQLVDAACLGPILSFL